MKNIGMFDAGVVNPASFGIRQNLGAPMRVNDGAIANGGAVLISELEKRDPLIREPLTSVTYHRDVPMKVGGGWVEFVTALNMDYGLTGGSGDGAVHAPGANSVPVIQANMDKDTFRSHVFSIVMRILFIDMQRQNITGRSLDKMLSDGVRLAYDKHMDLNCYKGMAQYGTTGLLNNEKVTQSNVVQGAGSDTKWKTKTPEEILTDINTAITETWEASGYDLDALPNHIILPYEQYNYIATSKVSSLAEKTIATQHGRGLVIGATAYCKGAGAGSTDRMAVYVHSDRFLAMEELVPLARTMTQPNVDAVAYDSVYMANVSEVETFYTQTIRYYDGI